MTLTIQLVGADGSTWPLMGLGPSPAKLANGLGGLHLPQVKHLWKTTARKSGQTWLGSRMQSRQFSLNVYIPDANQVPAFFEAVATDELAQLVVNGERSLAVRLDEDNQFDFVKDPYLGVDSVYPLHLIADRPEWLGKPVSATFSFRPEDTTNYYGADAGLGPPFFITETSLFATASVSNPGDLPADPVWTVRGPAGAFRVGVEGHVTQPPFALQSGDTVIIDTGAETITDPTGNSLWPLMGYTPVDFAQVPPGDEVPIAIGMDNAGVGASISVSLTPRFRRAWGVTAAALLAVVGGGGGSVGGLGDEPLGDGPLGD